MNSRLRLTLGAATLAFSAAAFAQSQPPQPPPLAPPPPVALEGAAADAAPVASGAIQRWLVNPNGDVDGLLLADGTQVAFPPHLSATLLGTFKTGDKVTVNGWRAPGAPVVRAVRLSAASGGRSVVDEGPNPGARPPAPRDPRALSELSASGKVARLLYTGRGDANGVLLDNGTIVRFPPHVGMSMAATLKSGSPVSAKGWGSRSDQGASLEATAIGTSTETMRELFAGPGADPLASPPGPRGPGMPGAPRPMPPEAGGAPRAPAS